jgi:hypothetical protein
MADVELSTYAFAGSSCRISVTGDHSLTMTSSSERQTFPMDSTARFEIRLTTRHSAFISVVWLIVVVIAYIVIAFRIDQIENRTRESGFEMALEFSKLVSLPLLEKDTQRIRTVLLDATKRPDVIYASVVDHQDQMVAFTGGERLLPEQTGASRSEEGVLTWEGGIADYSGILNFASEVTYGGTKIGQILIGLSVTEGPRLRNRFVIVALTSGLIVLFLIVVLGLRPIRLMPLISKSLRQEDPDIASDVIEPRVTCPLCGMRKPLAEDVFNEPKIDKAFIIEALKHAPGGGEATDAKGITLSELTKREDLSWIRRQVIFRCTEIIRKLAT